jgi:hypothetical protein
MIISIDLYDGQRLFFVLNFFGGINFVGYPFKGILCFA